MITIAEDVLTESMVANVHVRGVDGEIYKYSEVNPVFGFGFDNTYFSFIDPAQGKVIISVPHDRVFRIEYYEPKD